MIACGSVGGRSRALPPFADVTLLPQAVCDFCRTDSVAFSELHVPCSLCGHDTRLNGSTTDARLADMQLAQRFGIIAAV
jgi:hypothetical protein